MAVQALPLTAAGVVKALQSVARRPKEVSKLQPIASELVAHFGLGRRLLRGELERFFAANRQFCKAFRRTKPEGWKNPVCMQPHSRLSNLLVPALATIAQLADWLGLYDDELLALTRSFASDGWRVQGRGRDRGHYHRQWIARRGSPPRLLEAPKQRLKEAQQRVARGILREVPPHDAAHGFVRGRSVASGVAAHVGKRCVLRMDIEDCFASIGRGRVLRVFLNLGYPEDVAAQLTRLCTVATPTRDLRRLRDLEHARSARLHEKLRVPHLPQGASTSPALANLSSFRLDARLTGLAAKFGATYSRYADDLLFSGDDAFRRDASRCATYASAVLLDEGLHAAHHKTRIMCQGTSQRSCGLVLNERSCLPRRERQQLEAILFNCVRHGPSTQNRCDRPNFRAHLQGRVAHAGQFDRSGRLRELMAAIDWNL